MRVWLPISRQRPFAWCQARKNPVSEAERLPKRRPMFDPLAVPKTGNAPFVAAGFDRGASPCSLHPPPAAVASAACEDFFRSATGCRQATYFFKRERSAPECLRHSRGKKSLAGQKDGRHFAAGRETGIFPAKSAFFSTRVLAASEIAAGNFDAAAWVAQKSPAGRPPGFSVLSPRDIYRAFCLGPIQLEQGRPAGNVPPLVSA